MIKELHKLFPTGTRVSNKALKATLQRLYDKYGINAKAKAVDITRYGYDTKDVKIPTDNGRLNGQELTIIDKNQGKIIR